MSFFNILKENVEVNPAMGMIAVVIPTLEGNFISTGTIHHKSLTIPGQLIPEGGVTHAEMAEDYMNNTMGIPVESKDLAFVKTHHLESGSPIVIFAMKKPVDFLTLAPMTKSQSPILASSKTTLCRVDGRAGEYNDNILLRYDEWLKNGSPE